ncbi:MAG: hypothetical protein M0025_02355 [Elusimicrobia bacterium]|nr:hypothetical protein [Elusimicrobiota bacterium]MDA8242944.1 hypothetical protein [Elusimicrobiota bacterium]
MYSIKINSSLGSKLLAAVLAVLALPVPSMAARFMAVPFAETLQEGKWSIWQFALYEKESAKDWRRLNRLDIGLYKGLEAGVFVVTPEHGPSDTWLNLQYQPLAEEGYRPGLSVGVWDLARKDGHWFSDHKAAPSPFVAASKTVVKWDGGQLKTGLTYGFNRLHGLSGGADARFGDFGAMAEYAPKNLRLPKAGGWDAGAYWWFLKDWRARASSIGGNPMFDVFFVHAIGK